MPLQGYYTRFDPTDSYDELLFRASKGLQSAELNEVQQVLGDRVARIADALFKDGDRIRGAELVINQETGVCTLAAGAIYLMGAVREVAQANLTVATSGTVRIGVRLRQLEVSELEDPNLRDPAVGTRNYQEPGAGRLQRLVSWGSENDGGLGDFYPVYTVVDGTVLDNSSAPTLDTFTSLLARYDYESNGNYVVNGLATIALGATGEQDSNGNPLQLFTVSEGVGNAEGFKITKTTGTRIKFPEDPDLSLVQNEPHTFPATGTTGVIGLNYGPIASVSEVIVERQETVTLTHGAFSGSSDPLPRVAVTQIMSVTQGGTTYAAGTDYFLNADKVDWSPSGAEPAPGSTYSVTYRYLVNATPEASTTTTITLSNVVNGSLLLVDYTWKLPRIDAVCMDRLGQIQRVKGLAHPYNAQKPAIPGNLLYLAAIENVWGGTPKVANDAIRAIPFDQLEAMRGLISDLYDLVAEERLKTDISSREPSSKKGVFVDPFIDDDLRDAGTTQTAAIVDGELVLPISANVVEASLAQEQFTLLPYEEEVVLEQKFRTTNMKINPYQAFDPPLAKLTLKPTIDRYVLRITSWLASETTRIFVGRGILRGFSIQERVRVVRRTVETNQFMRSRTVAFSVAGLNPNEAIQSVRFDGVDVPVRPTR